MFYGSRRLLLLVLVLTLADLALAAQLVAQTADSGGVVPSPDAWGEWVLAVSGASAFVAQFLGSHLVSLWNKAGGWLDAKGNGTKRVVAVLLVAALGLATNGVLSLLTNSTNWIVTFLLSALAGVIATLNAATTIDTAQSKLAPGAGPVGTRYPA